MYFPSFLGQTQTRVLFVTAGLTQNNPVSHIIAGIQVTGYAGICPWGSLTQYPYMLAPLNLSEGGIRDFTDKAPSLSLLS